MEYPDLKTEFKRSFFTTLNKFDDVERAVRLTLEIEDCIKSDVGKVFGLNYCLAKGGQRLAKVL